MYRGTPVLRLRAHAINRSPSAGRISDELACRSIDHAALGVSWLFSNDISRSRNVAGFTLTSNLVNAT